MMHGASGTRVLVVRGRGTDLLLLALEISRGLLLRNELRDRATTMIDRHKVGDTLRLLVSQGRGHVAISTSLNI